MKGRKHKKGGGEAGEKDFGKPKSDLRDEDSVKPMDYTGKNKVAGEAEERKHGGRAKRKHGGIVHHEKMEHMKHAKHIGKVHGEASRPRGDRMPRKSGGRAGCEASPFSAAMKGMEPKGHKSAESD